MNQVIGTQRKISEAQSITDLIDLLCLNLTGRGYSALFGEESEPNDYKNPASDFGSFTASLKRRRELNQATEMILAQKSNLEAMTAEEIKTLKQFSGRGGLQEGSTDEYFTPAFVAEGMWDLLEANGFQSGNVLEPSAGAGVFPETKKKGVILTGTEINPTAAKVNQVLHPDDKIHHSPFEELAKSAPDDSFDSVIGNIPFGDSRGGTVALDPDYTQERVIERYFIHRAIDKVKPGGLVCLIVPTRVVSGKDGGWSGFRQSISLKAEFLGAHRMPSDLFKNQGTSDTITDILVLKKHPKGLAQKLSRMDHRLLEEYLVLWEEFISGNYFKGEGRQFIKGVFIPKDPKKFMDRDRVRSTLTNADLKTKLAHRFDSRINWAALESEEPKPARYINGDRRWINELEYQYLNGEWVKLEYRPGEVVSLDEAVYGAKSRDELAQKCSSPKAALGLTFDQALAAREHFSEMNLVRGAHRAAVGAAESSPTEFKELVYRYSLIGSLIQKIKDGDEMISKAEVRRLVASEIAQFGHPLNNPKLLKVGGRFHDFNLLVGAMDRKGNFEPALLDDFEDERKGPKFNPKDAFSIVDHLYAIQGQLEISLEDVKSLYTGDHKIESLGDLAHVENLAISPNGLIYPVHRYCSGNINDKITALQKAIADTSDQRLKEKYQAQINLMESKRKRTELEDITFSLRQRWIEKKYILAFLKTQKIKDFDFGVLEQVEDRYYSGVFNEVFRTDHNAPDGFWEVKSGRKFLTEKLRQLLDYMNGTKVKVFKATENLSAEAADERNRENFEFVKQMEEEFQAFMETHPDAPDLESSYNRRFNSFVPFEYSKEPLELKGVADWVKLHDYQSQAVRRLSEEGKGLLGFDVGLGKTFSALALWAYNKQQGRSKRTCVVVPDAVLVNWHHEAKKFLGSMDQVMVVGVEVQKNKDGSIKQAPVLDDTGKQKVNKLNGKPEFQDDVKVVKSNVQAQLASIPGSNQSLFILSEYWYTSIPVKLESKMKRLEERIAKGQMDEASAKDYLLKEYGDVEKEMDSLKGEDGKKIKLTYAEVMKSKKLQEAMLGENKRNQSRLPYFEDMRFTDVIVDEAHHFNNAFAPSSGMGDNVAYLSKNQLSGRGTDMATKLEMVRAENNGRGSYLLTATPVRNSPVDAYNELRLISGDEEFMEMGIRNPDDFLKQFCAFDYVNRTGLDGVNKPANALVGFQNLGALRNMLQRVSEIKNAQDVGLKLPDSDIDRQVVTMQVEQEEVFNNIQDQIRSKKLKGKKILSALSDMEKVTLDHDYYKAQTTFVFAFSKKDAVDALIADLPPELTYSEEVFNPELNGGEGDYETQEGSLRVEDITRSLEGGSYVITVPNLSSKSATYETEVMDRLAKFGLTVEDVDHPIPPKFAKLIQNLQSGYLVKKDGEEIKIDGGKQIIFLEAIQYHERLRRTLAKHIPMEINQIAIINGKATDTSAKLQGVTEAYNSGKIKLVICNKKAEVGVNLQKGTVAIHHLDFPWTPDRLQQRDGRGVRQGNEATHVRRFYYAAQGSADLYRLDLLFRKQSFIEDLIKGDKEKLENDLQNDQSSMMEELLAILSGNPEKYREEQQAKKEAVKKRQLEKEKRSYGNALRMIEQGQAFLSGGWERDKLADKESLGKAIAEGKDYLEEKKGIIEKAKVALEAMDQEKSASKRVDPASLKEGEVADPSDVAYFKKQEQLQVAQRLLKYKGEALKLWAEDIKNLDAVYERLKGEREQMIRVKKSYLLKKKDKLPFDPSLIDDPGRVMFMMRASSTWVFELGKFYKITPVKGDFELLIKVVRFNTVKREIFYTMPTAAYGSDQEQSISEYDLLKEYKSQAEVSVSEEDLKLERAMTNGITYEEITTYFPSKERFVEVLNRLYLKGAAFFQKEGEVWVSTDARHLADKTLILYPEPLDESFKAKVFGAYLRERRTASSYGARLVDRLLQVLYKKSAEEVSVMASEYGQKATATQITEGLQKAWGKVLELVSNDLAKAIEQFGPQHLTAEWTKEFDNKDEIIQAASAFLDEKKSEADREKERKRKAEMEALRNAPNFKEVPDSIRKRFEAAGLVVEVNTGAVVNQKLRQTHEPFSRYFVWDKNGRSNQVLYPKKELIKNKYSGSGFQGKINGLGTMMDSFWWHIPSTYDLRDLGDDLGI